MTHEKRNKLLAASLVVLTLTTVVIFFTASNTGTAVNKDLFKIDDPDKITRIVLQSSKSNVELRYNASGWTVNEKYRVDMNMIKVLIATLLQNEPKRPVAESLNDSIGQALEKDGIHVTVFSEGEVVKEFYAGGNTSKTQAYFKVAGTKDVYSMVIPGYRVYVSGIYELDESGFRDKYVFSFRWQDFKGMNVILPRRDESFKVVLDKTKRFYTIEGFPKTDTAKLNGFLTDVSLLTVDQYGKAGELQDSLELGDPVIQFIIEDVAKRKYTLRLFSREKNNQVPGLAGNELVYFERERIRPILRSKSFFAKP
jgi:hypothetical protein